MKENKDKSSPRGNQSKTSKEQQNTSNRNASTERGEVHNSPGAVSGGQKKPISHKTGDATNFGDRSYQED